MLDTVNTKSGSGSNVGKAVCSLNLISVAYSASSRNAHSRERRYEILRTMTTCLVWQLDGKRKGHRLSAKAADNGKRCGGF
jgi:hypothetical protein